MKYLAISHADSCNKSYLSEHHCPQEFCVWISEVVYRESSCELKDGYRGGRQLSMNHMRSARCTSSHGVMDNSCIDFLGGYHGRGCFAEKYG